MIAPPDTPMHHVATSMQTPYLDATEMAERPRIEYAFARGAGISRAPASSAASFSWVEPAPAQRSSSIRAELNMCSATRCATSCVRFERTRTSACALLWTITCPVPDRSRAADQSCGRSRVNQATASFEASITSRPRNGTPYSRAHRCGSNGSVSERPSSILTSAASRPSAALVYPSTPPSGSSF